MSKKYLNKLDTVHPNYSDQKIKQQLINYIYDMIDISKFKYKILEVYDDLSYLDMTKYYISGNYVGANCLMVFTKNKDKYYSFIVDRKTLSYEQSRINIDHVMITPVDIGLDENIYNGTIIDGILSQTNETKVFIITDLYLFRGENMMRDKIKTKMINVKTYLNEFINADPNTNNITMTVNHLYEMNEIHHLVNKVIPQTKQLMVRGIAFYPEISGTKLIYLFKTSQERTEFNMGNTQGYRNGCANHFTQTKNEKIAQSAPKSRIVEPDIIQNDKVVAAIQQEKTSGISQNVIPMNALRSMKSKSLTVKRRPLKSSEDESPDDGVNNKNKVRYISKGDDPIVLTFEIRKTDKCEVYKLFLVSKCNENGRDILKMRRFGIAYIPSIDCSRMCRELTSVTGRGLVKCQYNEQKEKWMPIEQENTRKCPDLLTTLEEKMAIIVDDE